MAKELVHEGDLFGIVSTGTSSIAIDLTYDRTRMEEAANRITGGGLQAVGNHPAVGHGRDAAGSHAPRARRVRDDLRLLKNLEQTHNRRKAVVLISNGYDFDPFASARAGTAGSGFLNNPNVDPNDPSTALMNHGQRSSPTPTWRSSSTS